MFNLKTNKKGISSIVQIIFLATLSMVSLALIFGYVKDLSNDVGNKLSPAADCISQKSKVISACFQENKIIVDLDVGLGEYIQNVNLRLNEQNFNCGESSCQSCSISGIGKKTIYLNSNSPISSQDNFVVSINGCSPESVVLNSC